MHIGLGNNNFESEIHSATSNVDLKISSNKVCTVCYKMNLFVQSNRCEEKKKLQCQRQLKIVCMTKFINSTSYCYISWTKIGRIARCAQDEVDGLNKCLVNVKYSLLSFKLLCAALSGSYIFMNFKRWI